MDKDAPCPRCGASIAAEDAGFIQEDMEFSGRTCTACGKTFGSTVEEDGD